MDKQVCLARYHCRGKSPYDQQKHIKTLEPDVQRRIAELKKK
jgi:hypothetical protein